MFWGILTLRLNIGGTALIVRSEHDGLKCTMSSSEPHGQFGRWRLTLSEFDSSVKYRPGLKNQVPDALFRCIDENPEIEEEGDHLTFFGDDSFLIIKRIIAKSSQEYKKDGEKVEKGRRIGRG